MTEKKIINFPKIKEVNTSELIDAANAKNTEGLDKIHSLIHKNWNNFILKIKETLQGTEHDFFINTLPLLKEETLSKINKSLNFKEVEKFQSIFENLTKTKNNLKINIDYVLFEIKKISLNSAHQYSDQTITFIKSASAEDLLNFLKDHNDYKSHISACISTQQLANLLNLLEGESLDLFLSNENSATTPESFEEKVNLFFKASEHSPFKESLKRILKDITYKKEKTIFTMLKEKQEQAYLKEIANECFPSFLLIHFPKQIIAEASSEIDQLVQIDFLKNLTDEERLTWLNKLAEEGTKKREVLEIELDSGSQSSIPMLSKVEDFYRHLKSKLQDEKFNTTKTDIISDWLENKVS